MREFASSGPFSAPGWRSADAFRARPRVRVSDGPSAASGRRSGRYHRPMTRRRPGERMRSARLYLRGLHDEALSARHSQGARTRTAHLLGFLAPLQAAAREVLEPSGEVSLLVVNSRDWQLVCSYPYGLPFTRSLPGTSVVIAAADYPERLKKRFDDLLLAAGKAGAAPGPVSEFLDLLVGHEWGHAVANRSGLRTGV